MFDSSQIKKYCNALVENGSLTNIIASSIKDFPKETCGFIFADGSSQSAHNSILSMRNPALNTGNAFLIDQYSWKIALKKRIKIVAIYHSHTTGNSEMSGHDKISLCDKNLFYLIVAVKNRIHISTHAHWWENNFIKSLAIEDNK